MLKRLFDKVIIFVVIGIILLILFGLVNGMFNIKDDAKIRSSEEYWVNNNLAIVGYTNDNEIILKNNMDSKVEIGMFSVGSFVSSDKVSLDSGKSFVYDLNITCDEGDIFSYPVNINYSYNHEDFSFTSEEDFVGRCK